MNTPKVSIVVPCYNQAQYLDEALESVLSQTYENWECIIVDDGSTDNTQELAEKWILKDNKFKYLVKNNGGLCSARNFGIEQAQGIYILPLDADDKIAESYIALAMGAFEKDMDLRVVYCHAEKFGLETGAWNLKPFSLFNLSQNNMIFCSAFFKKQDWIAIGGYDTNMVHGWEDWEFWISLLKNGGNVHQLEEVCFFYRINPNSMLQKMNLEESKQMMEYLSIKHIDFFVKHYGSFKALSQETERMKHDFEEKLKSEKFVIDVFFKKFFGFSIFGKYK
uniref:glycosyltransferase family 2 protein n=1 Tax=Mariniflexile sp. TaxID=1979402 RepID=UPI0040476655